MPSGVSVRADPERCRRTGSSQAHRRRGDRRSTCPPAWPSCGMSGWVGVPEERVGRATVSVVIPVHNGMPHLPGTLASVLAQTRIPDEIIVVENGSNDGTAEWLAEHAPAKVSVI